MASAGSAQNVIRRYFHSPLSRQLAAPKSQASIGSDVGLRRKLVIIGDGACGKTSLLSVFTLGYFPTVSRFPIPNCLDDLVNLNK